MAETATKIFPVYIVVDVSYSMKGEPLKAADEIIPELMNACAQYNALADMLRFSLITFSDTATTLIPMCAHDQATPPSVTLGGGTSYGAAFREVRSNIDKDVADLKMLGHTVMRPSVFFITDGDPNDDQASRQAAWADLTDKSRRTHPNVVAFGVGDDVTDSKLKQYISHNGKAFVARNGSAADGLRSIIEVLVMSVVASANNADAGGNEGLIIDTSPVGDDLSEVM